MITEPHNKSRNTRSSDGEGIPGSSSIRRLFARDYCDTLDTGVAEGEWPQSTLILIGPGIRSTFLRDAVIPEMRRRNWLLVSMELEPGGVEYAEILLHQAIDAAYREFLGPMAERCGFVPTSGQSGRKKNGSITERLRDLETLSQRPIGVVINAAHFLTSSRVGRTLAYALRGTSVAMTHPVYGPRLRIVLAGPSGDGLATLHIGGDAPFSGASVRVLPAEVGR